MHEIEDGKQHQDGGQFFRNAYGFQRHNTDDDPNDFMRQCEEASFRFKPVLGVIRSFRFHRADIFFCVQSSEYVGFVSRATKGRR